MWNHKCHSALIWRTAFRPGISARKTNTSPTSAILRPTLSFPNAKSTMTPVLMFQLMAGFSLRSSFALHSLELSLVLLKKLFIIIELNLLRSLYFTRSAYFRTVSLGDVSFTSERRPVCRVRQHFINNHYGTFWGNHFDSLPMTVPTCSYLIHFSFISVFVGFNIRTMLSCLQIGKQSSRSVHSFMFIMLRTLHPQVPFGSLRGEPEPRGRLSDCWS
jgi:hypothetical protein